MITQGTSGGQQRADPTACLAQRADPTACLAQIADPTACLVATTSDIEPLL